MLVVPSVYVCLYSLTAEEMVAAMRMAQRVALTLRGKFEPVGLNLWQPKGLA